MSRKNRSLEEKERRAKIRDLFQMGGISSTDASQNLFKETIAELMENGIDRWCDSCNCTIHNFLCNRNYSYWLYWC